MDPFYRFDARFTALVPMGPVPDGLRLDARFERGVGDGELAGAMVRGIDDMRFPPDDVGALDVREVPVRGSDRVEVQAGAYLIPPAGFALPFPGVMLAPNSVVLSKEDSQCG